MISSEPPDLLLAEAAGHIGRPQHEGKIAVEAGHRQDQKVGRAERGQPVEQHVVPALARVQAKAAGNAIESGGPERAVEKDPAFLGGDIDLQLLDDPLRAQPAAAQGDELRVQGRSPDMHIGQRHAGLDEPPAEPVQCLAHSFDGTGVP